MAARLSHKLARFDSYAQARGWPLEEVTLVVSLSGGVAARESAGLGSLDDCTYTINGLVLEGAALDEEGSRLALSTNVRTTLGPATFCWMPRDAVPEVDGSQEVMVTLPVYLNESRKQLLFNVQLRAPASVPVNVWQQRGVCLLAWTQAV